MLAFLTCFLSSASRSDENKTTSLSDEAEQNLQQKSMSAVQPS